MVSSTPEERQTHIELWRGSGLSKAAYCREAGLNYQTFVAWTRSDCDPSSDEVELVQLIDDRGDAASTHGLCAHIGAVSLHFNSAAPAAWVAAVVRNLSGC